MAEVERKQDAVETGEIPRQLWAAGKAPKETPQGDARTTGNLQIEAAVWYAS